MIKKECKQCGKQFTISDSEISFYKSKKLNIPKRCKECRKSNKKGNVSHKLTDIDDRLEDIVNIINKPSVSENKINTTEKRKTGVPRIISCFAAIALIICVAAVSLLSGNDESTDEETVVENAKTTVGNVQTGNGYTQNNDSDDEALVILTSDTQPNFAFTEIPGGNDYDDRDAVVFEFKNENLLESHFQKHGKDMGFESAEEYEQAACNVINSTDALHKKEAEDGDDVYYIEKTNDFVIVSTDGYIRTYFRPDSGKKYYDKQ